MLKPLADPYDEDDNAISSQMHVRRACAERYCLDGSSH
jgi:hypothetical protein